MKNKAIISKLNIIFLIIGVLIMIFCFISTKSQVAPSLTEEIKPMTVAKLEDGSKEYFFDLRDYDYHYSGFMFYTAHQQVFVYNAGQEIYSFENSGGFWGSTPGSGYHFIDINSRMMQIAVIVKPVYDVVADQELTFYIGTSYEMYNDIMLGSMPRFFVSLLIVILSIVLFAYYAFMHEKQNLDKKIVYLAGFTFFCGIWSINETDVSALLIFNRIFDSLVPYLCLMLVVPPFILFFDSYLSIRSKIIKNVLIYASMLQFVVLTFLHFTKILEYRESLVAMQIMLLVATCFMVGGMIVQFTRRQSTRQIEICAVGLSTFLLSLIVDISAYYRGLGDADKIGRFVFLLFAFTLAWDMIKDANEMISMGKRAKQLEIFALTDTMTGLLNRNAFESHANAEAKLDGLIAIVADANGLKKCNDTYGHEAGDEYITLVADIFNKVYGKYGNCYRIGGDEFCCIIPAGNQVNIEKLKKLFLAKIYNVNIEGNHMFDVAVAVGAARYDSDKDGDFKALVKRADAYMYENKRSYKSS